jgi:hypothetical protein
MNGVLGRVPNYIGHTWLAWAFEGEVSAEVTERALARVGAHYAELYARPLRRLESFGARTGLALWARDDERLRWPLWAEAEGGLAAAYTSAPTGWGLVLGDRPPAEAAVELARRLRDDPELLARLNAPLLLGVRDPSSEELTILNDFIGAARLYELEAGGARVWSNRLGALPLFAGVSPRIDERAWSVLAATGWFLGERTAIAGARKVARGSALEVRPGTDTVEVRRTPAQAAIELVTPRDADLSGSADAAAEHAVGMLADVKRNWATSIEIDLSGGRDSRISAAAAVAAGIDGRFQTVDLEPGEVEIVRELLARAPRRLDHIVRAAETPSEDDDLRERVRAYHLVHDGMLNPHSLVRGPLELPEGGFLPPIVSGHGGEVGHGFYYGDRRTLRRVERMDVEGLVATLERGARRQRDAAREEGYAAFREEVRRALEEGRERGLEGASLLDFYYLTQRLAFRSGLGARNDRQSACATPAFVRACFDLDVGDRLQARLHPMLIERLLPQWKGVRVFEPSAPRPVNRARLWEREDRVAQLEEMIDSERIWRDVFDPERVRELWQRSRSGGGRRFDEQILTRLAWRVGFEDHLSALAGGARSAA